MELAIMVGLPLSGKSTTAKSWLTEGTGSYQLVCPDDIRLALGHEFFGPMEPVVWAIAETQARALLIRGLDVLIDATNVTHWERSKWARLGREFGASLTAYEMNTPASVCIERAEAAQRSEMIPVINRMQDKRQWLNADEGFERVYISGAIYWRGVGEGEKNIQN